MSLSKRDRDVLKLVGEGKTAEEIAATWGTSPAKIVTEVDRLTSSLDWLSNAQRFTLLMDKLWRLISDLEVAARDSGFDAKVSETYLKAIESAMGSIERATSSLGDEVERVEAFQAKVFMKIIEKAFYATVGSLKERYKDLPVEELEYAMRENIVWVAAEFDAEERDRIE